MPDLKMPSAIIADVMSRSRTKGKGKGKECAVPVIEVDSD